MCSSDLPEHIPDMRQGKTGLTHKLFHGNFIPYMALHKGTHRPDQNVVTHMVRCPPPISIASKQVQYNTVPDLLRNDFEEITFISQSNLPKPVPRYAPSPIFSFSPKADLG